MKDYEIEARIKNCDGGISFLLVFVLILCLVCGLVLSHFAKRVVRLEQQIEQLEERGKP